MICDGMAFDCSVGESLRFGADIGLQLSARIDEQLFVFIDAARRHVFDGNGGYHASAPCGGRHRAHVLILRDGDAFAIGPVHIVIASVQLQIAGANVLRDVRLQIDAPASLDIVREMLPRAGRLQRIAC
jgi:hypothetical protein